MTEALLKILSGAPVQLLIFLYLVGSLVLPALMTWRVEQAVIALTSKLECGTKINIATARRYYGKG